MKVVITFYGVVAGMNGANGIIRMHWSKRKKIKSIYYLEALSQTKHRFKGQVKVSLHRYTYKLMDWDNLASTLKLPLDAIQDAKIIKGDSPKYIPECPKFTQSLCSQREQRTVIIIEDYEYSNSKKQ